MPLIIKTIFALLSAVFGLYSIVQPKVVARASGFDLLGNVGVAELRTAGGFFLGIGIAPLILSDDAAYQMLGIAYFVTFAVRLLSVYLDGQDIIRRDFIIFGLVELVSGLVLIIPQA
ncbi:MAG: hypothetical protein L0154_07415 [Chloroflexi bacterium]|nr:hypothetical protein [Chloroflexota bacterium]